MDPSHHIEQSGSGREAIEAKAFSFLTSSGLDLDAMLGGSGMMVILPGLDSVNGSIHGGWEV